MAKKRSRIDTTPWYKKERTPQQPEVWTEVDAGFGKAPGDHKSSDDKREIKLKKDLAEPKTPLEMAQEKARKELEIRQGITSTPKEEEAEVFDQPSTPTAATQAADTTTPSSGRGDQGGGVWIYERGDGAHNDVLMTMGVRDDRDASVRIFNEDEMKEAHKLVNDYTGDGPKDMGKNFVNHGTKDRDGWVRDMKDHTFVYYTPASVGADDEQEDLTPTTGDDA